MTQHPYAESTAGADVFPEAERTSVMAILSLVCSLICCIPGLGILGSLLGVFALIGIGGSRGRVGGKGLAISGIIIGILMTVIWIGAFIGFNQFYAISMGRVGGAIAEVEAGDYAAARGFFDANLGTIDDSQIDAFRAAYQSELGSFVETPDSLFSWFGSLFDPAIGPQIQQHQGQGNVIPTAATFDQGTVLLIGELDQTAQTGNLVVFSDFLIILPDGTELRLSDFGGSAPAPSPGGDPDPVAPDEAP